MAFIKGRTTRSPLIKLLHSDYLIKNLSATLDGALIGLSITFEWNAAAELPNKLEKVGSAKVKVG